MQKVTLNVSGYMNSAKYSDLEVRCNDVVYLAHRVILCSQIKFFDNACTLGFKEATDGVIDLSHDDPDAVRAMMQYAYTATYTTSEPVADQAFHHVKVFAIGSKYDIPALQLLAQRRIRVLSENYWEEDWFPEVIRAVYGSTHCSDRGLRDIVVGIIVTHHLTITQEDNESPIQKVLAEVGELSRDCFDSVSHQLVPMQKCLTCGGNWINKFDDDPQRFGCLWTDAQCDECDSES